jgi:chorismate synthase
VPQERLRKKILKSVYNVEIIGYVKRIKDIEAIIDPNTVTLDEVESNMVRCPRRGNAAK